MKLLNVPMTVAYQPLATTKDLYTVVEGPRGTAKTRSILTLMVQAALTWPGSRIGIARATRKSLAQTVMATLENQVFPALGMRVPGGAGRDGRDSYLIEGYDGARNGSEIVPLGIDNPEQRQKLLSSEWTKIYVAEATELSQKMIEDLGPCMRHFVKPSVDAAPCSMQIICDCNPAAPSHWLNTHCEAFDFQRLGRVRTKADYDRLQVLHNGVPASDPKRLWKRIVTRHQDNLGYWDHKAWDWTVNGRQYREENLDLLTGFQRRRWLDGEWVASDGIVFPEFTTGCNVVEPFTPPATWPRFMLYDPGHDHPTCILWLAVSPTGCIFVYDEIYRGGLAVGDFANLIRQREDNAPPTIRRWGDPRHIASHTAQSPRSIQEMMASDYGLFFDTWPMLAGKGKTSGVEALRQRVKDGMLRVVSTCTNVINEFQSWAYKRTSTGELPAGDDAYVDSNNEAMDCLIGYVAMNPTTAKAGAVTINRPVETDEWGDAIDEDYREAVGPGDAIGPPSSGFAMMRPE